MSVRFCPFPFVSERLVSVLLSANVERFSVSRMQYISYDDLEWPLLVLSQEILEEGVEVEGGEVCVEEGEDDPVGVAEAGHQAGNLPLHRTPTYQLKV